MTIEKMLEEKIDELLLLGARIPITVDVSRSNRFDGSHWYSWYVHVGGVCLHSNCWDGAVAKVKAHIAEQLAQEPLVDSQTREALLKL